MSTGYPSGTWWFGGFFSEQLDVRRRISASRATEERVRLTREMLLKDALLWDIYILCVEQPPTINPFPDRYWILQSYESSTSSAHGEAKINLLVPHAGPRGRRCGCLLLAGARHDPWHLPGTRRRGKTIPVSLGASHGSAREAVRLAAAEPESRSEAARTLLLCTTGRNGHLP